VPSAHDWRAVAVRGREIYNNAPLKAAVRTTVGLVVLGWAVWYLAGAVRGAELARVVTAVLADPIGLTLALAAYAVAFGLRTWAWARVLPGLPAAQAWAALHVSLLGNHVLPMRLGEALRPASVARRTGVGWGPATASSVTLRGADLASVLVLALLASPALVRATAGDLAVAAAAVAVAVLLAAGVLWSRRSDRVRLPGPAVVASAFVAWVLEAAVVWEVARVAGVGLSPAEAVGVTAVTIAAQALAVTPGGFGTYEAAATAAMVAVGVPAGPAFAVALTTHAVKTAYALAVGGVGLVLPSPTFWGRLRLDRPAPPRPPALPTTTSAPVVVMIPVYDEEGSVGDVVRRVPDTCHGRRVEVLVVDDGSRDASVAEAAAAGATVVSHLQDRGHGPLGRLDLDLDGPTTRRLGVVRHDALPAAERPAHDEHAPVEDHLAGALQLLDEQVGVEQRRGGHRSPDVRLPPRAVPGHRERGHHDRHELAVEEHVRRPDDVGQPQPGTDRHGRRQGPGASPPQGHTHGHHLDRGEHQAAVALA
jgi:uncharacterized membrane protein YbhN (UPF0104 family)